MVPPKDEAAKESNKDQDEVKRIWVNKWNTIAVKNALDAAIKDVLMKRMNYVENFNHTWAWYWKWVAAIMAVLLSGVHPDLAAICVFIFFALMIYHLHNFMMAWNTNTRSKRQFPS